MKTIATIFIAVLLFTVNGYSQTSEVKALLENQKTKTEVFNAILGDHQLMSEFMTAMKGNKHASMMMQNGNSQMQGMKEKNMMEGSASGQKMQHGDMMGMMENNPEMMKNMMEMCMKDSAMRCEMAEMMIQKPEMMKAIKTKMGKNNNMGLEEMHQSEKQHNSQSSHKH